MKKRISVFMSRKWLYGAIMICVVAVGLSSYTLNRSGRLFEISKNLEIFINLYKEVNTNYVEDIDPSKLMKVGIDAMLETLDPFTNYIAESQVEQYRFMSEGRYHGIGALVNVINGEFVVTEPFEESPAYDAGIKAGDVILEIDGLPLVDLNMDEFSAIVKGAPNTEVAVKMRRHGNGEVYETVVVRSDIDIPNVPHFDLIDNDYAYVNLTTFTPNASGNIAKALRDMKRENPEFKGIILDLRDNGGGLLQEAVRICNLFIPKDLEVVSTRGKVKDWDRSFKTTSNPTYEDLPIVVLVNERSASASEIVSGVLQDYDRGVLIGRRTYGKGLVQNTKEVGYNSRVKVTTAKYYIPSGRCIQSVSYEDGEPLDIPDSLRGQFKTRAGRLVLDGGGVAPDILMDEDLSAPFIDFLNDSYIIFNYVTEWTQKHDSIAGPTEFVFEDFDKFKSYALKFTDDFESESEAILTELRDIIREEYGDDKSMLSSLQKLEKQLQKTAALELEKYKAVLISQIEEEIIKRYYYQKGRIKYTLKEDPWVVEATNILKDQKKYSKILEAQ